MRVIEWFGGPPGERWELGKAITGMRVLVLMMTSEPVLFHFLHISKERNVN